MCFKRHYWRKGKFPVILDSLVTLSRADTTKYPHTCRDDVCYCLRFSTKWTCHSTLFCPTLFISGYILDNLWYQIEQRECYLILFVSMVFHCINITSPPLMSTHIVAALALFCDNVFLQRCQHTGMIASLGCVPEIHDCVETHDHQNFYRFLFS